MPDKLGEAHLLSNESKKEIQIQLDLILSSALFSRSDVLTSFLKFIVEETLNGNATALKEYTIAVSALGKPSDFNPQINSLIRINAGRLRRLLNAYYEGPGINDVLKIEVVKGTYVPVFRKQIVGKNSGKNELINSKFNSKTVSYARSRLTLAVLPFRNLLPDNEYQFFVNGFGEELTQIFSTSEDIAVVSHFSTLKYANHDEDIRIIGADLGVHYVITGSVKRSDKKIKVNIGLVETMNGVQIWSKNYIHNLTNHKTIYIQDQINNDVFAILSGHYGFIIAETIRLVDDDMKKDLETFDAILWFHHAQLTNSEADFAESRKALEKILQNDPNNVMCLLILGDVYLSTYALGYTTIEDPINEAVLLIKKALLLAPSSQYAHMIQAWANIYLGKKKEAIDALEVSVRLAKLSPTYTGAIGFAFACAGEYERGQAMLEEFLNLNPYCPWWHYMGLFFGYFANEKYEKALQCTHKMNASEDVYLIPLLTVAVKGQLGLISNAKTEVKLLHENFPEIIANLKIYLGLIILDESLVDKIIQGAKKAGLPIA